MADRSRAVIALTWIAVAAPASAQDYPVKPLRLIVPFPAGGGTDVQARALAAQLRLGDPSVESTHGMKAISGL